MTGSTIKAGQTVAEWGLYVLRNYEVPAISTHFSVKRATFSRVIGT